MNLSVYQEGTKGSHCRFFLDKVRGALAEFNGDDRECVVTFIGPGYAADVVIERDTGRYRLTQTSHGLVAVLNDLHKGRDSGTAWSLLIDISAALLCFISFTGLGLIFFLKMRRTPGLFIAVSGTILTLAIYYGLCRKTHLFKGVW